MPVAPVLSSRDIDRVISGLEDQGATVRRITSGRYRVEYQGEAHSLALGSADRQQILGARAKLLRAGLSWPLDPTPKRRKHASASEEDLEAAAAEARARALAAEKRLSTKSESSPIKEEEGSMSVSNKMERIGPDQAMRYLEMNTKNRRLSTQLVNRLASMMKAGKWQFDGSPLRFDVSGALVDGQHRLWAIIESETTQEFLVVRGVSEESMATMDTGKSRSFADILTLNDRNVPNAIAVAASTSLIYRWEHGLRGGSLRAANSSFVPYADLLAFYAKNRERLIDVSRAGKLHGMRHGIAGSVMSLAHWTFEAIDSDDADFFFNRISDGVGLDEGSPILALRNWMSRTYSMRPRPNPEMQIALIVKAWNAFRDGDSVRVLSWRRGGANPEPFPEPR